MSSNSNPFVPVFSGTTGTNLYVMVLSTVLGRLGFTKDGSAYRIRVEPSDQSHAGLDTIDLAGWKSGCGGKEYRKSKMAYSDAALHETLAEAAKALLNGGSGVSNPELPGDIAALVNALPGVTVWTDTAAPVTEPPVADPHAQLVALMRDHKVPGWQFAKRWSLATLQSKAATLPS